MPPKRGSNDLALFSLRDSCSLVFAYDGLRAGFVGSRRSRFARLFKYGAARVNTASGNQQLCFARFFGRQSTKAELSRSTQTLFNMNVDQMIQYLDREIADRHFTTRMFADDDASVPALRNFAKAFNDHYGHTERIEASEKQKRDREAELRNKSPVSNLDAIDSMAQKNATEFPRLRQDCEQSNQRSETANVGAVEISFSDGTVQRMIPVASVRTDGAQNRAQVTFATVGDGFQTRTLIFRSGKYYYVGVDGREWEVSINRISYRHLTQVRPFASGGASDACFLSQWYQRLPGAANPAAPAAPPNVAPKVRR